MTHLNSISATNEEAAKSISNSYLGINNVINEIEQLQTAAIQKHEVDFITAYKDHMLKVQVELIHFQKKASEYYQNLKKDERIKNLETSITWLKNESVRLAGNIERLTDDKKDLTDKLKLKDEELKSWRAQAVNTKAYNMVLQETIEKLKSPALLKKYEMQGRLKA